MNADSGLGTVMSFGLLAVALALLVSLGFALRPSADARSVARLSLGLALGVATLLVVDSAPRVWQIFTGKTIPVTLHTATFWPVPHGSSEARFQVTSGGYTEATVQISGADAAVRLELGLGTAFQMLAWVCLALFVAYLAREFLQAGALGKQVARAASIAAIAVAALGMGGGLLLHGGEDAASAQALTEINPATGETYPENTSLPDAASPQHAGLPRWNSDPRDLDVTPLLIGMGLALFSVGLRRTAQAEEAARGLV